MARVQQIEKPPLDHTSGGFFAFGVLRHSLWLLLPNLAETIWKAPLKFFGDLCFQSFFCVLLLPNKLPI